MRKPLIHYAAVLQKAIELVVLTKFQKQLIIATYLLLKIIYFITI